ncbi:ATP-binding protein [Phenylobacterium sp. J426]|uniref:sensor histidine kinase n=1 Tax=Phenylobacterium sp. J426 TaxID=2898439 RepID=UPI0021511AF2|nr:ATP-binding protein [Phenylobacterium sp. J426]MCR5875080.1 ATP-binding protein [Phenylobacterium sp. J426]
MKFRPMWWDSSEHRDAPPLRNAVRHVARYLAVLPIIGGATGLAELFYRITGSDRLSAIFLAGVLLSAFLLGSGPAYVSAALAFLVYLFLVNPRFQFSFGGAEDFNVMMMFLAVSVLIGLLTGRMRDEAARARARQRVNGALLDATRDFSATSDETAIRQRLAAHIARAARGEAEIRDNGGAYRARAEDAGHQASGPWRVQGLRTGDADFGEAAWRPRGGYPLSEEEQTLIGILADTGAAAISRARLAAGKAEAEARARTEDLRNALLSSISHDLRTPLAAILASATSLREFGGRFDPAVRADLADTIREEAERLDATVANLLSMSRLEAGQLTVATSAFNVPEVVERAVGRRNRTEQRPFEVRIDPATPEAEGDAVLFEQALGNVVENAMRYSPAGAPITVTVAGAGGEVMVEVTDAGPGVAPEDAERIFEKFYRAPATGSLPGTGLGLAISRGLLAGMGGRIAVRNRTDGARGLVATLCLKAAA